MATGSKAFQSSGFAECRRAVQAILARGEAPQ